MRKLFVLLLIALVPLSIGCRLFKNDDAGPDIVLIPQNPPQEIEFSYSLPAASISQSLRGALYIDDIEVSIGGLELTPGPATGSPLVIPFTGKISKNGASAYPELKKLFDNKGKGTLTLKVVIKGVARTATINVDVSAIEEDETKTIKLSSPQFVFNNDGTFSFTVNVIEGGSGNVEIKNETPTFQVLDVEYKNPGGEFKPLFNATGVATSGLTIRVIFNKETISKATDTFTITAKTTVSGAKEVVLTQADLTGPDPVATAELSSVTKDGKNYACVVVTLKKTTTGTNPVRTFSPGKTYTLSMTQNATQGTFSVESGGKKLPANYTISRTFTTAAQ